MFEIVSKTNNLYDVLDTDDGVIESCSFLDIISFCESGAEIKGVSFKNDSYVFEIDGLCCHKVMKGYKFRLYPNKEQQIIKRLQNDAKDFENVFDIVDYNYCTDISSPQRVANMISNFISASITNNLMERHFNLLSAYDEDNIAKQKLIEYFNEKE